MHELDDLNGLHCGELAEISHYTSELLPAKFYELGLQPGAKIMLQHKAPFNGPICIQVLENDTLIAIRKSEARSIIIIRKAI
jgi:ferrous iron transport protein A